MIRSVDLNADVGEGFGVYTFGHDQAMLDLVTSVNIACGFHAGDPVIMYETLRIAYHKGVQVGAHPGFGDLWGFGRRMIHDSHTLKDIGKIVLYQIGALQLMATTLGHRMTHVKLHGALYNQVMKDVQWAKAIAHMMTQLFTSTGQEFSMMVMPNSMAEKVFVSSGIKVVREIYADRSYTDDGSLLPRHYQGAVLHDPKEVRLRVMRVIEEGCVRSINGVRLAVTFETICVHGDTPHAIHIAEQVRLALEDTGVKVLPFTKIEKLAHRSSPMG